MTRANLAKSRVLVYMALRRQKDPYRNAYHAILHMPDRAYYVEGLAVYESLVVPHAWVELDGDTLEPTAYWRRREDVEYFAASKYERPEAIQLANKFRELPLAWHINGEEYERAAVDAHSFALQSPQRRGRRQVPGSPAGGLW